MLIFGSVTIDAAHEPPRPPLEPRRRKAAFKFGTVGGNQDFIEDWGLTARRVVRFVSSEHQGFVTADQAASIMSLYESGGPFSLQTDLLGPLGSAAVTYSARFAPDVVPKFDLATPGGNLWHFDIIVVI